MLVSVHICAISSEDKSEDRKPEEALGKLGKYVEWYGLNVKKIF